MENPILKFKEEQKKRAKEIKKLKSRRKIDKRGKEPLWKIEMRISNLSYVFRHNHIAYCEFCGTRREKIEFKVRKGNEANEDAVDKLKEELKNEMWEWYEKRETVCNRAA